MDAAPIYRPTPRSVGDSMRHLATGGVDEGQRAFQAVRLLVTRIDSRRRRLRLLLDCDRRQDY